VIENFGGAFWFDSEERKKKKFYVWNIKWETLHLHKLYAKDNFEDLSRLPQKNSNVFRNISWSNSLFFLRNCIKTKFWLYFSIKVCFLESLKFSLMQSISWVKHAMKFSGFFDFWTKISRSSIVRNLKSITFLSFSFFFSKKKLQFSDFNKERILSKLVFLCSWRFQIHQVLEYLLI